MADPLILDADSEGLLVDYLAAALADRGVTIAVATRLDRLGETASKRPSESVILYRTGGIRRDLVTDFPTITVDVRAKLETRAVYLANLVRALLHDLPGRDLDGHPVYLVQEFSGPSNQPTEQDRVRYSQVLAVAIRAAVI